MNLAKQKLKSDYFGQTGANPSTCSSGPIECEPQRSETRFGFKAGEFVVVPAHGVGQILAIEEQTVAGSTLEVFVIYFARSKMTLRAPTRKAVSAGIRKLSEPLAMERVRRTLNQPAHKARGNWSRLVQEYESKINSGDIIAIAEVVRDLYRPGLNFGQSFSERQLYTSALERLSGEVALVDGILEREAVTELENLLNNASQAKRFR
jgi:CarD family transcriptional regulator